MMGTFFCFAFAGRQYAKSWYPYGIIARRSMTVSPINKLKFYAPIAIFYGALWYYEKEYPRQFRCDFTSDDEE